MDDRNSVCMEFAQIKWKKMQGGTAESEDLDMDLKTITLENGWTAVVTDKPSGTSGTGAAGFAAELDRVAQATSGGAGTQAVYEGLSADAKAVLERLKAGEKDITLEEWSVIRRELRDAGLITPGEFADSDPNMVVVGYVDVNGDKVQYPYAADAVVSSGETDFPWGIEWQGDPLQYLGRWLEFVRSQRDNLNLLALRGGPVYDTSHLTRRIEANEKVAGLVKSLLECC